MISVVLTVILLLTVFVTPVAARQRGDRGESRGRGRQNAREIQYLDAEVQLINGQPVLRYETEEGYSTFEFPWPELAIVNGKEQTLARQGDSFLFQTADGYEKIHIEEFKVALTSGYLVLAARVNPVKLIPIAVAYAALKAAGVAITTATVKAATILIAAGKNVTARTIHAVVGSWPAIKEVLSRAGKGVSWWYLSGASFAWLQGNCILCGQRTPDGHFGDILCSGCARSIGQFFGLRP